MKSLNHAALLILLAFTATALGGCADTWEELKGGLDGLDFPMLSADKAKPDEFVLGSDCPRVSVVNELGAYNEFSNPRAPLNNNLVTRTDMAIASSTCVYNAKSVTVDLKVNFDGKLGPAGRKATGERPFFSLPFFVAVMEPGGNIMAKEVFAASLSYPTGTDSQRYTESLREIIPIGDLTRGPRYKVLVGFQLTSPQLKYNREEIKRRQVVQDLERQRQKPETIRLTPADNADGAPIDLRGANKKP